MFANSLRSQVINLAYCIQTHIHPRIHIYVLWYLCVHITLCGFSATLLAFIVEFCRQLTDIASIHSHIERQAALRFFRICVYTRMYEYVCMVIFF